MKKSKIRILFLLLAVVLFFLFTSSRPYHIKHSTVHTYETSTETELYVVTNRPIWTDQEKLTQNIISNHLKLNHPQGNVSYRLILYTTNWHYQLNKPYRILLCNKNGAILQDISQDISEE